MGSMSLWTLRGVGAAAMIGLGTVCGSDSGGATNVSPQQAAAPRAVLTGKDSYRVWVVGNSFTKRGELYMAKVLETLEYATRFKDAVGKSGGKAVLFMFWAPRGEPQKMAALEKAFRDLGEYVLPSY